MMRPIAIVLLASALFGATVTNRPAAAAEPDADLTPEKVRNAIDRGVAYLKSKQQRDGRWKEWAAPVQTGGVTALCTLALLTAGVPPDDPQMQKSLEVIAGLQPQGTYTAALATMALARANPDKYRLQILRNVKWLEATQVNRGLYKGAWSYPYTSNSDDNRSADPPADNSNAQFAVLALHEAERVGVPVSDSTWRSIKTYWEHDQNADGSWSYPHSLPKKMISFPGTGSMTCAGITSLVIAADRIQSPDARVVGDTIDCCRASTKNDFQRIENGLLWLESHFSVNVNPNQVGQNYALYYLYGMERAGRLTGRRFIGKHDWYREGAARLIHTQDNLSGFWRSNGAGDSNPVIGTCYALLFLSKGRWPVLLGKLKHTPANDWNRHRSDVANLTRYVETRWKRDLTWQIIDLRYATVDDLLQTPVLYLCGSENPLPDDAQRKEELAHKLRDYLDRGGFLFAEGYCGGTGFDRGFRELMQLVFPEPEYKLHLLDLEHPIWYAEEKVDVKQMRPLWGVDFGCRTSVVYAPLDPPAQPRPSLSCLWELSHPERGEKYSKVVQDQIDAADAIGLNILAYATNRELQTKENLFHLEMPAGPGMAAERGRIAVATLRHPGGCNAAPRAVANLMDAAQRELKLYIRVRPDLLNLTGNDLFNYHLVFMHGRTAFRFTDAERRQLKTFIERGGMLMADSICASPAFTASFRREMETIFPKHKLEKIAVDDPLFTTTYGGFDLKTVTYREPLARSTAGGALQAAEKQGPPSLEGVRFGDRWGVIFSPYDLSCALEKHDSLECRGYKREDAARIGLNVLLYSLQQ